MLTEPQPTPSSAGEPPAPSVGEPLPPPSAPRPFPLPIRRPDLQLSPWGTDGAGVVKSQMTGEYFKLGAIEFFLLSRLDGRHSLRQIAEQYQQTFQEPLAKDLFREYLLFAHAQGWLALAGVPGRTPATAPPAASDEAGDAEGTAAPQAIQSPLYFRFKLFDPDRTLTAMEPWFRWAWTWTFFVLSLCGIVGAGFLLWSNRTEFHSDFADALHWQTLIVVGLTLITVTIFHEYAHGLTCKHFGGEVHEMGFLMMMGMPCLYANVSDAWLFPEKWRRMAVTLAGAYFDLCLWALAIGLWYVSAPETLPNYLATVVIPVVGLRCFINLSPLFKLDGYYLLTDWLDAPNLYQRGRTAFQDKARWLLWGQSASTPSDFRLALYGMFSWGMSLSMMCGLGLAIYHLLGTQWAGAGIAGAVFLGLASRQVLSPLGPALALTSPAHVSPTSQSTAMPAAPASPAAVPVAPVAAAPVAPAPAPRAAAGNPAAPGVPVAASVPVQPAKRTGWVRFALSLAIVGGLLCMPVPDLIHGAFELRPSLRIQVRAPVAGFIKEVKAEEGSRVSPGTLLALLDIPDLDTRLGQKRAELAEANSRLALLQLGPRQEELEWQQRKVDSSKARVETAKQRVARVTKEEAEESKRLEQKVAQHEAELAAAQDALRRAQLLARSRVLSSESLLETEKRQESMEFRLGQTKAELEAHKAGAGKQAQEELALRQQELQEAEAQLAYVKAGSRPEEIDAEKARISRIKEELRYLEDLKSRLKVSVPSKGIVTTPHLREKSGQYVREGDLLCEVEDTEKFEAEIVVSEDELDRIHVDQPLRLKVRAMPWDAFETKVLKIAPKAARTDTHARAILTCEVTDPTGRLRSGMTGSARIDGGWKPLGSLLLDRSTRFLKNEFWWW